MLWYLEVELEKLAQTLGKKPAVELMPGCYHSMLGLVVVGHHKTYLVHAEGPVNVVGKEFADRSRSLTIDVEAQGLEDAVADHRMTLTGLEMVGECEDHKAAEEDLHQQLVIAYFDLGNSLVSTKVLLLRMAGVVVAAQRELPWGELSCRYTEDSEQSANIPEVDKERLLQSSYLSFHYSRWTQQDSIRHLGGQEESRRC